MDTTLFHRFCRFFVLALSAVAVSAAADSHVSLPAQITTPQQVSRPLRSVWNPNWSVADLDGDDWPDVVRTESVNNGYRVNVRLSGNLSGQSLDIVASPFSGLNVEVRDIDGDHDLDLVLTTGVGRRAAGLWINDGHGLFTKANSQLYSEGVWRGPPSVDSSSDSTSLFSGLVESFPTYAPGCVTAFFLSPDANNKSFAVALPCDLSLFLPGKLHPRPPPLPSPVV